MGVPADPPRSFFISPCPVFLKELIPYQKLIFLMATFFAVGFLHVDTQPFQTIVPGHIDVVLLASLILVKWHLGWESGVTLISHILVLCDANDTIPRRPNIDWKHPTRRHLK